MNQRFASMLGAPTRSKLIDRGTAVVMIVLTLGSLASLAKGHSAPFDHPVVVLVAVGLLLRRHRWPRAILALILAMIVVVYTPAAATPAMLALLAVTTDCEPEGIVASVLLSAAALVIGPELHQNPGPGLGEAVSHLFGVGLATAFGLWIRARGAYVNELQDRAQRIDRERELDAARAVADERVRIARELHDVVAHNVSLMVVQTQAAAAAGGRDADPALRAALDRVGNLGRDALSEMHRMLGVLRVGDGAEIERAPQPGVDDLEALVTSTRDAGLDVGLEITGAPYDLPAGVDLSAYRIVQEALTNVVRHARARHVEVGLRYTATALELTVADDGHGDSGRDPAGGPGHGLVGMRERVALFGGRLEAGDRRDAPGYRIHAVLPVPHPPRPRGGDPSALVSAIVKRVG